MPHLIDKAFNLTKKLFLRLLYYKYSITYSMEQDSNFCPLLSFQVVTQRILLSTQLKNISPPETSLRSEDIKSLLALHFFLKHSKRLLTYLPVFKHSHMSKKQMKFIAAQDRYATIFARLQCHSRNLVLLVYHLEKPFIV